MMADPEPFELSHDELSLICDALVDFPPGNADKADCLAGSLRKITEFLKKDGGVLCTPIVEEV